ncbi:glycosyltransferase family 4 protein [Schlesneria paludicola]|uniref:glycosyltransferase family 4 protein n=1 Tax=Schlesneria paludicola TaxID=360056 RepID=UPI00029A0B2F|nr:glycosyltransferase family 4 protein [Schlesneria paludicola]
MSLPPPMRPGLHLAFLTSGPNAPSSRYRVFQYIPHLRKLGFRCTVANSFPEKYDYFPWLGWRLSRQLKRMVRRYHLLQLKWSKPDVIILERELFDEPTCEFEEQLTRFAHKIVLDIDDAVFMRYPEKFDRLAQLCDGIIAGNSRLVEYFQTRNPRVALIPTCVDMDLYPQRSPSSPTDRTVIGWIGTASNLPQLSLVLPALREVSKQTPIELRIITSRRDPLDTMDTEGISIRFVPWNAHDAVQQLQHCDIGIMPLEHDDPWNHYKCGLKLIEYMAIGLPAIASPVGVNAQIVTPNVDGYLASNTAEWVDAIQKLAQSPELRARIGDAARITVMQHYSTQAQTPQLIKALLEFSQ